jgi:hypothetical protein
MAQITVTSDTLIVEITGMDRLWALTSRLEVPIRCVRAVSARGAAG